MDVAPPPLSPLAARRGFVTLGEEAWAPIRSEYLAGATGKQISQKWGCSRVSVYDHASKGGWTKQSLGQAVSATVLEEVRAEREAKAARAGEPLPEASPILAAGLLLRQAAAAALMARAGRPSRVSSWPRAWRGARACFPTRSMASPRSGPSCWPRRSRPWRTIPTTPPPVGATARRLGS